MAEPNSLADDLIWGAANIAAFIGRTTRQAWEALDKGELPARQVNGRWCASRARLRSFFTGAAVAEAHVASPAHEAPHEPAPAKSVRRPAPRSSATVHKLQPRPNRGRAA